MSFNKRYYDWDSIVKFSNNGFDRFNRWILNTDARIIGDIESRCFLELYIKNEDIDKRKLLYEAISEGKDFISDLHKSINVIKNTGNKEIHQPAIDNYLDLFRDRWKKIFNKYQSLIIE